MSYVMTLYASGLSSKFGFNDGDKPNAVMDMSIDMRWHLVLAQLVRTHLLPLIPGVDVYETSTSHNPIRAVDSSQIAGSEIEVEITLDDVLAAAATVKAKLMGDV